MNDNKRLILRAKMYKTWAGCYSKYGRHVKPKFQREEEELAIVAER
jgi:hypothetical protein